MPLFGIGAQKPHHYREMVKVAWENRDQLPFAWRILEGRRLRRLRAGHVRAARTGRFHGMHLCMVRLELMRLNTAPALDPSAARRCRAARGRVRHASCARSAGCRSRCCGGAGERGLHASSPGTRRSIASPRELRAVDPQRIAFYLTSRGITNEVYYAAQKAARFLGTNHVDNSARLCHAASTVGDEGDARLRRLHVQLRRLAARRPHRASSAPTSPNNQPVTTKYLHHAKQNGAQIAVVNPYREPGLERYWIPSIAESAVRSAPRSPTTGSTCTPAATWRFWSACCGAHRARRHRRDVRARTHDRVRRGARAGARRPSWDAIERESGAAARADRRVRATC